MKKERFLLPVLAAVTVLASCGRNAEIPDETVHLAESADEAGGLPSATMDENGGLLEDDRQAFGKALWDVYLQGILPDGGAVEYVDRESAEGNGFAVTDIDGDGREELLLLWSNASMSGMVQIMGISMRNCRDFQTRPFMKMERWKSDGLITRDCRTLYGHISFTLMMPEVIPIGPLAEQMPGKRT